MGLLPDALAPLSGLGGLEELNIRSIMGQGAVAGLATVGARPEQGGSRQALQHTSSASSRRALRSWTFFIVHHGPGGGRWPGCGGHGVEAFPQHTQLCIVTQLYILLEKA
jgi:hypothetical protein